MAITASDILFKFSGGAANGDPDASLGGVMSSTEIVNATIENLFDNVSGDESDGGDTEYRCFYIQNNHGTLTWQNVVVWINQETPSADTEVDVGLDPAGVGDGSSTGVATSIADEGTSPSGVSFSHPTSKAGGLAVGNIPPGEAIAVWLRRTVSSGAAAANNDNVVIRAEGDTAA